ncbi:MAG: hypothetical protein GY757_12090, partial [bacterium]|nr:hypothetical protein [bacterium]
FNEEWNCYKALSVYRNVTGKRIKTPPFSLVALCRDIKKFLGAVKFGIIDKQIKPGRSGASMVNRFGTLKEIPYSGDEEADILKLIGVVINITDTPVAVTLEKSFRELLVLTPDEIKAGILKSPLPFDKTFKTSLFQLTRGGAQHFKHEKYN